MSGGMWSQYLREDLAASEHDQWRTWASYMLSHMTLENVLRWLRQSRTDYADLSPAEQRSDHQFVEMTLDILERHGVVAPPREVHLILERVAEMTRACPLGMRCRGCQFARANGGDLVCGMAEIHTLACELVGRRRG